MLYNINPIEMFEFFKSFSLVISRNVCNEVDAVGEIFINIWGSETFC